VFRVETERDMILNSYKGTDCGNL